MEGSGDRAIAFGPFRLLPQRQLLLEGDRPVRLGSRALDILVALVERPGALVSKEELIGRVWPDTFVEEANLRVHIAALRRALGDGQDGHRYLANVPGRGYRFVAPLSSSAAPAPSASVAREAIRHNLPAPLARMVGREDAVAGVIASIHRKRFVSIVGPGGIGKTTVAIAVADRLSGEFEGGVCYVDLAPLSDAAQVPGALGSAFGLAVSSSDPLPGLISYLAGRRVLIVLDNCEPVIDVVANLAEALLQGAPFAYLLTTSREPLRAEGEHVQRLAPLDYPAADPSSGAEALTYSAVQLFVERATAVLDSFSLTDEDAPIVADICRRLDGIALAIELAAGRVDAFGVKGVAEFLDDRFRLLTRGRRTVLPRHQTLTATLDWSYRALGEAEQAALRTLSIFPGTFDLEAARALLSDSDVEAVFDCLADLVAKSLISADVSGSVVRYRMWESTRAYGLAKLAESGETADTAQRHAVFVLRTLLAAEDAMLGPNSGQTFALFRHRVHCIRAAFEWAVSPNGDRSMLPPLVAAAVPLWMHLSLVEELTEWTQRALAALDGPALAGSAEEMRLQGAHGSALMFTRGAVAEAATALRRALGIALELGDVEHSLRALWGLWIGRLNNGSIVESLELARQFAERARASPDFSDLAVGDRMIGFSLHFLGEQALARESLERMLGRDSGVRGGSHTVRFHFDQWTSARAILGETLWLQGFPDQAMRAALQSVAEAETVGHALTSCNTLTKSAAVALLVGDLEAAEGMIARLAQIASEHALSFWQSESRCLAGMLQVRMGDIAGGLARFRSELRGFAPNRMTVRYIAFLAEFADALSRESDHGLALATITEALDRSERNQEHWCMAELLRVKGEILLRQGGRGTAGQAEALFSQSLDWCRRQGALSWELRTSLSLAASRRSEGRHAEARAGLAHVFARFTEGFGSTDLRMARQMLDELAVV